MNDRMQIAIVSIFLTTLGGGAFGAATNTGAIANFAVAKVYFEQNATDGDVEVVFQVKAGDDGLSELIVVSPDNRTVINFRAPDSSTMGIRQFQFESPEPPNATALMAAYPEGIYVFSGKTAAGAAFSGKSTLNHRLPATTEFLSPRPASKRVSVQDLKISWRAVAGVASYIVKIENDDLNVKIAATVPGASTNFAVPNGFLLPGTEYELSVGTVTPDGNISFVETTFTTRK